MTLFTAVDQILEDKATCLDVLIPDMLDDGASFDDIADRIRDLTGVRVSSRSIRRWAERIDA